MKKFLCVVLFALFCATGFSQNLVGVSHFTDSIQISFGGRFQYVVIKHEAGNHVWIFKPTLSGVVMVPKACECTMACSFFIFSEGKKVVPKDKSLDRNCF